jgi:RNA polymerase sigma factor for flagellar operon FliA
MIGEFEEQLILNHMPLAYGLAIRRYRQAPHALELDELKSVALEGLVEAASKWQGYCERNGYDPHAPYFLKYSSMRVAGALIDFLRSQDWATRSVREKSRKINNSLTDDEKLTITQMAERTGLSEKEIKDTLIAMSRAPVSLDVAMQGLEGENGEYVGLQVRENEDTESRAAVSSILTAFADAVRDLPITERLMIVLHYHQGLDLRKCAELIGIPDTSASSLHSQAVSKLLKSLEKAAS